MPTAYVVGSGPNGLAGAVRLAEAGLDVTVLERADRIGGGMRTSENTLPGLLHDDCSAFHPTGAASPYLQSLGLERHGLQWLWPEIQYAHPLDDGSAGLAFRSVESTAEGLGRDGASWARLFGPLARQYDALAAELFRPVLHVPRHPLALARFGPVALLPATVLARRWQDPQAKALYGGVAAHLLGRLDRPVSAAVGLMLGAAAHAYGWPVAKGGSQAIATALAARLTDLGGRIETRAEVTAYDQIGDADVVLFDLSPPAVARILGERLPQRAAAAYRRYRFGPGAFKVDLAIEGEIPWRNPDVGRAGTVHLGGTLEETAAAEADVVAGRMPWRPFVLLGQQYAADPTRSAGGLNPVYAYAHVPAGWVGDATDAVVGQIERFAPGFRHRIRATFTRGPAELEAYNPNYVGGDIATGRNSPVQVVMRPRISLHPYRTGAAGAYLCSAATPPGAGVHGMGGFHAAETALADLEPRRERGNA